VVVQAPEHVIENARRLAKAGDDPVKRKRVQKVKPPEGQVSWTEETFNRLRGAVPEPLVSRMKVDHSTILNVVNQPGDPIDVMRALMEDNHEDERGRAKLSEQAQALGDELLAAGVLEWLEEPDRDGRTLQLAPALQADFALNQPLASFALAAFDLVNPESEHYTLDLISVVEAILGDPFPVLAAQAGKARGEAVAEMKAEGIEYDERMELLEQVTYPKPLGEELLDAFRIYRETHPWVRESDLSPKSVVRDMYEWGFGFSEFVAYYGLTRSEGLVLRYLSDAFRALRQTVPERFRTDELEDIIEWLGETVRQTDSSLLDEWEALTDPESVAEAVAREEAGELAPPARPITANERAFAVMVRNAMFQKVQLAARDRFDALAALDQEAAALLLTPSRAPLDETSWEEALGAYWKLHEWMGAGPEARSPEMLLIDKAPPGAPAGARVWSARQIVDDPESHGDFAFTATVDLDASDAAGVPVIVTQSFGS
jgi:hypothetical protein